MGILFISHSRNDNDAAVKVWNWLKETGWGQAFLDIDPAHGLAPGHSWQQELKQAGERCSGVLILISPSWLASAWCRTEFLVADQLGKKVFPLLVVPTSPDDLLRDITSRFQFADISTPEIEAEGFERLAIGLKRAGLDPKNFPWPPAGAPQRPIYRGLEALEEQDAAIFFGRDAQITKGLDCLRRMRDGARERMLVILGASGAGKSSFLRAGLIARLKRDEENFLVLPIVRPQRSALPGEHGFAIGRATAPSASERSEDLVEAFSRLRATVVGRLKRFAVPAGKSRTAMAPTIVIPLDQAEELFTAEAVESHRLLELLARSVLKDGNAIIVATIRSDSFEKLQSEPRLAAIPVLPFSLAPIPHGAFKDIIECPARLANPPISIEPALTELLLQDLADDDALPLMAFTLERLLHRTQGRNALKLADYVELGGLRGAITAAVDAALANAARESSLPNGRADLEKMARVAFIPALVQLNDIDSEPRRRVERLDAFPEPLRTLVRRFVDERLLVCDRREIDGATSDMVEVAHEAILRQWVALKSWISEERDTLRALEGLRRAAAEWRKHATQDGESASRAWLIHRGTRLEEAEALLARSDFAAVISKDGQEYIAACRVNENSEILRERQSLARTRRLQRRIWFLVGIAASFVLFAGLIAMQMFAEIATEAADVLTAEAAKASESGDYEAAVRYAVAGVNRVYGLPDYHDATGTEAEIRGAWQFMRIMTVLHGHTHWVTDASFSPDGSRVVTSSRDTTARIWDARTGAQIAVLRGHAEAVLSARFSPDGNHIVTASEDRTIRVWDAHTGAQLRIIGGHKAAVNTAMYSPDGRWIVTASADKTAMVWDSATGALHSVLRGHQDVVNGAWFSRDGKRILTASADKTAVIWDFATNTNVALLRGHEGGVESASFSPDSTKVVTASDDKTVRIWDATTGSQLTVLTNHEGGVNGVAYNSDGTRLVTASEDKTARIWDARTGQQIAVLYGHKEAVLGAAFSPDGSRIVTASDDKTARVWDARSGNLIVLRGHLDWVNSAGFSPDGTRVVTASNDKTVRVWSAASGQQLWQSRHDDAVESVEFSHDGKRIVSGSDDGTARIWDVVTGRQLMILPGHHDKVYGAVFSRDGSHIAIAFTDGTAVLWDLTRSQPEKILRGHTAAVTSANFSPDGRRIVTGSRDMTARIWDTASGKCTAVLRGHRGGVTAVTYSADGRRILTAGADGMAVVWNAQSGDKIITLKGHRDRLTGAAFSANDARIVTASRDRTARIWDATTGREIAVLRGHRDQLESASFSPDGSQVVTASDDDTARIWTISGMNIAVGSALIQSTCRKMLAAGLSQFSPSEMVAAGVLDLQLDGDACRPSRTFARAVVKFWAGVSN